MKKIFQILLFFTPLSIWAQKPQLILPIAHAERLRATLFSKDDRILITSGDDNVTKFWDVATRRLYAAINGSVVDLKLTPNGKTLAIIDKAGIVKLVDMATFQVVKTINPATSSDKYWSGCFSPDGQILYLGGDSGDHACVWTLSMSDFQLKRVIDYPTTGKRFSTPSHFISLSPDGKKLIDMVADLFSTVYNTQTWENEKVFDRRTNVIAFTPSGSVIAVQVDKENRSTQVFSELDVNTLSVIQQFKIADCDFSNLGRDIQCAKDGSTILLTDTKHVWRYDVKTQRVQQLIADKAWQFNLSAISNNGKLFVLGKSSPILYSIEGKEIAPLGYPIFMLRTIASSPVNAEIMVGSYVDNVKYLNLVAPGFSMKSYIDSGLSNDIDFSSDGKTAAILSSYSKTTFLDLTKQRLVPSIINFNSESQPISGVFSPDGNLFGNVHNKQFSMIDVKSKKLLYEKANGGHYQIGEGKAGVFSPDSKQFIFVEIQKEGKKMTCVSSETGTLIWSQNYAPKGFKYTPDGRNIIAYDLKTYLCSVLVIEASTGAIIKKWDLKQDSYTKACAISNDAKTIIALNEDMSLHVYDITTQTQVAKIPGRGDMALTNVSFLKNKRYAVSTGADNYIRFYDLEKKVEIAKMVLFANTNDWAVFTEDGRFDASPDALKSMYYVKGKEFIPLESLYEKFYTPKLLQSLLEGIELTPPPINIDDVKSPPTVKINFENKQRNLTVDDDMPTYSVENEQVTLKVQADCPSDVITEIRLFHNGKLIGSTRNLVVEDDNTTSVKSLLKSFTVVLNAGENRFKAVAFNSQRTESKPDEIIVNYKPQKNSNTEGGASTVNLYLVVIGINKYKNPRNNLNYATADATSFKEAIEKGGSSIFSKTNIIFLGDAQATKEGITTELNKIKATATTKDVFIFYYAGHGVMNEKKDFYLVPYDVIQMYGQDGALAQKGLSANELQQFSRDIKAQKQLFILDACQSAGALEALGAARGAAEEKAIAQLARATGTHWLTASGSEQSAAEFPQLGHGTFTYVLLEALSGKADKGGDKKITVKELDAYLQEVVPEVTMKYRGTPQYPASYGYGNDFPIGVVKN
jgi:WD40 repeat protein